MEQSQLTIMAYLNEEFTGGHTNFLDTTSKPYAITHALEPKTGKVTQRVCFNTSKKLRVFPSKEWF